ncbi:MAG: zincin-like metallopeptidase domain-containing protein [Gemmatimonadota bacterium]|nr:zincin-like metallopeptidase domain-containing protein [Gemmatimonadota bacterium]MDE2871499.1 zincin-like metallopeptidase domain-containing protein [Gemmatimonadota bacterium]
MSARPRPPDFHKELTARILAALRKGVVPWRRPWRSLTPTRYTGLPFTGTNGLVLSLAADSKGYANPFWLTRAQGRRCGAKVLDGEEGTRVLRPLPFPVHDRTKGARDRPPIPLMVPYEVFNGEQFDRLPPRFRVDEESPAPGPEDRIGVAEDFFAAVGAKIAPGGDSAAYDRAGDIIRMPILSRFDDPVGYYSTLAHEAIHWTGHRSRMGRESGVRFGDPAHAFEEIVAELGASFVMGGLGLPCRVERDHAPYIGHWISALQNDERAIHRAASHAQRAADFLLIKTVAGRVRELAERPLDHRAWIVVYLDVVEIGPHPLVGAVGVDAEGTKRVLGLRQAGSDPYDRSAAAEELLRDVVRRGVRTDRRRLVVTDGSAQLRDAAVAALGGDTYVQACRPHREREVLSRLRPGNERDKARKALREAWAGGADGGPRLLQRLAGRLARDGRDGAANRLRAGSGELFTVDRFGLDPRLAASLVTTGVIDCASSGLPRQICGVPSWGDREMALAWAAASFLETERRYMRIRGHRRLQLLKDHLDQIEMPFGP